MQQANTCHQLPQVLLVYQWTAALCHIWPSSIPDAAPLHNLLSSALASCAELLKQLPHMQTDQQALELAATDAQQQHVSLAANIAACSSTKESTGQSAALAKHAGHRVQGDAELQDAPLLGRSSHSNLAGPVTAALLEVAALVLEPLGFVLLQQHEAESQHKQPPGMSGPASSICAELHCLYVEPSGGMACLLKTMLAVCLDQLVLHAERKQEASTQLGTGSSSSSMQQCLASFGSSSARIGTAAGRRSSGSSTRRAHRSIAEVAEGYLLQHADTLQAKEPSAPSRAAVLAWGAVCENMWADTSLPITLQAAAIVLANIQPSTAAASCSGGGGIAAAAAVAAVDTMQQCAPMVGRLGLSGQDRCSACMEAAESAHTSTGSFSDSNTSNSSSTSSTSTSRRASACATHQLSAVLPSEPVLSLACCSNKAAALSALCMHFADQPGGDDAGIAVNSCTVANTLLAIASALVSLQGVASLPVVSSVVAAAYALVLFKPSAQPHDPAKTWVHVPASLILSTQPQVPPACASTTSAGPAPGPGDWQLCLSLAADLTTAVLQLDTDFETAARPGYRDSSYYCVQLLVMLLGRSVSVSQKLDTAMQLRQLHSAACALQLVEASLRGQAACIKAWSSALGLSVLSEHGLLHSVSAYASFNAATHLISRADESGLLAQVMGSLQGQQLLQSCTSLLLTSSSIMQSSQLSARPADLVIFVQMLQLLQRSESIAAGGTYPGMSQSLAAGLALVGRCLVVMGTALGPPDTGDSSAASEDCTPPTATQASGRSSSSMQKHHSQNPQQTCKRPARQSGSNHAWRERHLQHIHSWLSACSGSGDRSFNSSVLGEGEDISSQLRGPSGEASVLQQAMHDLLDCVQCINQALQQRAAAAGTAAAAAARDRVADGCQARSHDSSSSSSNSPSMDDSKAGRADAQHSDPDQQQRPPADWMLGSIDSAQQACSALLGGMRAVLAPLRGRVGGRERRQATAAAVEVASHCVAAGEALCAVMPCSACCNNPRCSSLDGVSASFALVRGKGCVCGGCLGPKPGGAAAVPCTDVVLAAR